jgi:hypothetical protein
MSARRSTSRRARKAADWLFAIRAPHAAVRVTRLIASTGLRARDSGTTAGGFDTEAAARVRMHRAEPVWASDLGGACVRGRRVLTATAALIVIAAATALTGGARAPEGGRPPAREPRHDVPILAERRLCERGARRVRRAECMRPLDQAYASESQRVHQRPSCDERDHRARGAGGACRTELSASRSLLRQLTKLRDGLKLMEPASTGVVSSAFG